VPGRVGCISRGGRGERESKVGGRGEAEYRLKKKGCLCEGVGRSNKLEEKAKDEIYR